MTSPASESSPSDTAGSRPPISTYRLQLHAGFTFKDAAGLIDYLGALGIGDLYTSPILAAAEGSTHGYDVIDHARLNPELQVDSFSQLIETLHTRRMGYVLDIVPNHMGVETNDNPQWNDLLAYGRAGPAGQFFDLGGADKLLLPILGKPFEQALADEEIRLVREPDGVRVAYFDRRFPLRDPIDGEVERINQDPAALRAILERQHYRLADWREGNEAINYRRFFDVTSLAAIAMERQEVFEHTHQLILRLVEQGAVTGLRLDHPDGLRDPVAYFHRLQDHLPGENPFYVVAEKILAMEEPLPPEWPLSGTSGYDFLIHVNALQVDPAGERAMTDLYQAFTGVTQNFEQIAIHSKLLVLDTSLISELSSLTRLLSDIAGSRFPADRLKQALRQTIAHFPVYRTYLTDAPAGAVDAGYLRHAIEAAMGSQESGEAVVYRFLQEALLGGRHSAFTARFQQLTSPVAAKGVEDTAFYRYHRLISLNEVGGDPSRFGIEPDVAHRYFAERQARWPGAMSPLSTHDTKRSEDIRARLNVLSEIPDAWAEQVWRWSELARPGLPRIDPNDEYLLYQTLLGVWPTGSTEDLVDRVSAYMTKALREAKQHSSWIAPDEQYEAAVTQWVSALVDPARGAAFQRAFLPFQQQVSRWGMIKSIAQTLLKLWAPGVPDTYQGTELWDYSLVDPDNRRPVDYALRRRLLARLNSDPPELESQGKAKLYVHQRSLLWRRGHASVLNEAAYVPLEVTGPRAGDVFAFMRVHRAGRIVVVTPRRVARFNPREFSDTLVTLPDGFGAGGARALFGNRVAFPGPSVPVASMVDHFFAAVWVDGVLSGET